MCETRTSKTTGGTVVTEQADVQDEPKLHAYWVSADDGEVVRFTAERIEEYDGGLGLYVGDDLVGLVASGRWIAYWVDNMGHRFGD